MLIEAAGQVELAALPGTHPLAAAHDVHKAESRAALDESYSQFSAARSGEPDATIGPAEDRISLATALWSSERICSSTDLDEPSQHRIQPTRLFNASFAACGRAPVGVPHSLMAHAPAKPDAFTALASRSSIGINPTRALAASALGWALGEGYVTRLVAATERLWYLQRVCEDLETAYEASVRALVDVSVGSAIGSSHPPSPHARLLLQLLGQRKIVVSHLSDSTRQSSELTDETLQPSASSPEGSRSDKAAQDRTVVVQATPRTAWAVPPQRSAEHLGTDVDSIHLELSVATAATMSTALRSGSGRQTDIADDDQTRTADLRARLADDTWRAWTMPRQYGNASPLIGAFAHDEWDHLQVRVSAPGGFFSVVGTSDHYSVGGVVIKVTTEELDQLAALHVRRWARADRDHSGLYRALAPTGLLQIVPTADDETDGIV